MKKLATLFLALLFLVSCSNDDSDAAANFLPMNVGNYWKYDNDRIIEITGTLQIQGDLYYEFTRNHFDTQSVQYLRIDGNSQLIEGNPLDPGKKSIIAKFNANAGDEWWTNSDEEKKVTLIVKKDTLRTFYEKSYNSSGDFIYYDVTEYIKDFGWRRPEIRIDGEVFYFN